MLLPFMAKKKEALLEEVMEEQKEALLAKAGALDNSFFVSFTSFPSIFRFWTPMIFLWSWIATVICFMNCYHRWERWTGCGFTKFWPCIIRSNFCGENESR